MAPAGRVVAVRKSNNWLFQEHKRNALRRGIPFLFTLDEWVAWWRENLGDDWRDKRGAKKGFFVMARLGDIGDYIAHNVKCVEHSQNARESKPNNSIAYGEKAGQAKITEAAAVDIFTSTQTYRALEAKYGLSWQSICDIRARRTWVRATEGLTMTSTRGRNKWG